LGDATIQDHLPLWVGLDKQKAYFTAKAGRMIERRLQSDDG
jgi:hypothetical protein